MKQDTRGNGKSDFEDDWIREGAFKSDSNDKWFRVKTKKHHGKKSRSELEDEWVREDTRVLEKSDFDDEWVREDTRVHGKRKKRAATAR